MRKAYEEYKATGIQWLPEIPKHWEILKLRQILSSFSEKNHPNMPLLSVVREKGVIIRNTENIDENHNYIPDDLTNYKLVKAGQFAMNKMKAWQGSYGVSNHDGIVSPAYFVFNFTLDIDKQFFNAAIRSKPYVSFFGQASDGIRVGQWDLSMDRMKDISFYIPPREEQEQIVRFLDWKVSSINKLINLKQQEITELKELKKATISDAVTHGLDKTVPMKDSGISWLGKIPNTWNAIKIKWLFKETNERNIHNNAELLSFSRNRGLVSFADITKKQPSALDLTNYKLVHPGQLLENRMQAWSGMFICATRSGCVSPDYSVFSPQAKRYVNTLFYEYVFRNSLQVEQFANASRGIGTGFNRLYTPEFGAIYTIYPPREEQEQIVRFLDARCAEIDRLIAAKQAQITNLHDLKSSLIADVVTGQIDVRDVTIPNYKTVQENADEASDTIANSLEAAEEV